MNELFKDKEYVIKLLEGSYRKLKSYFYYNKNMIFMRKKLAIFEMSDMNREFNNIANYLLHPKKYSYLLDSWVEPMDFYVLPKKFSSEKDKEICSNLIDKNKKINSVNFFIDAPLQIHILDTLWAVCLGKIAHDKKLISTNCYANKLKNIYHNSTTDFYSNRLFEPYFNNYAKWRNKAFEATEKNYNHSKHSILISIDIKNYYYSLNIQFNNFNNLFSCSEQLKNFKTLTQTMQKVYLNYTKCISKYNSNINISTKNTAILPIGLLSSMIIANVYLSEFDERMNNIVNKNKTVKSYGRYVDDMIFVFTYNDFKFKTNSEIIHETLIKNNIISGKRGEYHLSSHKNLKIQNDKINILHISPNGSRAILDYYNNHLKITPSQTNIIPWKELDFPDFEEAAYFHENMNEHTKIREIGNINTNSFKISRYFSSFIYDKKSLVNLAGSEFKQKINEQKYKILNFFTDSQAIEFYNNWINIFYFYLLFSKKSDIKKIKSQLNKSIININYSFLGDEYKPKRSIVAKLKKTLKLHLEISYFSALAIKFDFTDNSQKERVFPYIKANLFNHHLVTFPLINYIDFKKDPINLLNTSLSNITNLSAEELIIKGNHKLNWSPRFISIEEFYQYLFITKAHTGYNLYFKSNKIDIISEVYKQYCKINHMLYNEKNNPVTSNINYNNYYSIQKFIFSDDTALNLSDIKVAVANFNLSEDYFLAPVINPTSNLSIKNKEMIRNVFSESYDEVKEKRNAHLIIMPEGTIPIEWLSDIVTFSKKSQIAIIGGLQYIVKKEKVFNYLLHIFPFEKRGFKSAFIFLREKNDYSPIEKVGLAKHQKICNDAEYPNYQLFDWKRLKIGSMLCFEFTDITARSLYKGKIDLLVSSEFNKDTSYFSSIIESSVKDLHTTIIQANTSIYGDSRITGPLEKNYRNIIQIKGGNNNNCLIGSININRIKKYQNDYYYDLEKTINELLKGKSPEEKEEEKPKIAKLPARYNNEL